MIYQAGDTDRALIDLATYKIHILAVVDGGMIVYKYYGKNRQRWHYKVEHPSTVETRINAAVQEGNQE
jgi:hypothetical protein